jgi:hypothetical protein
MRRLIVFQIGNKWFAHVVETTGGRKEFRRIQIPQTVAEIEAFARREGYEIEWDEPIPPQQPKTR